MNSYRLPPAIQNQLDVMRDKLMGMYTAYRFGRETADVTRAQIIGYLDEYFEAVGRCHTDAVNTIQRCWQEKTGFCLYLRNFALGARSHEHVPMAELLTEEERSELDFWTHYTMSGTNTTVVHMSDRRTQSVIAEILGGELPVISISNPDDYFVPSLPTLVLPYDDWASTVRELIDAAKLIIIYCADESRGLSQELLAVKEKKREVSTVVLRQVKDEGERILEGMVSRMGGPSNAPDVGIDLSGFNCVLDLLGNWPESESERERVRSALRERAAGIAVTTFASPPPPLKRPAPPPDVYGRKKDEIKEVFEQALCARREGDFIEAELLAFEALATAFEIGDDWIKASVLLEISRLQFEDLRKFQTAIHYLGIGANLYERLGEAEMFCAALGQLALYHAALRDAGGAHEILRRLRTLLWGTNQWERCLFLDLEANVEGILGNTSASDSARDQWTRTYEGYRSSGGEPQTNRAAIIALTAEIPLKVGTHYVSVWLNSEQGIAALKNTPDLGQLMLDGALGEKDQSILLDATKSGDERWELSRFIRLCRENDGRADSIN